jgi:hypothetical protein
MHLGRDRAGERPRLNVPRPELKLRVALGEKFENDEASNTTRPFVLSAGTLPEGEWRKIAALLSG